jgi:hypothetical protein
VPPVRNRPATWINLVFASIVVVGVFVQVYLIASFVTGAGEDARDAHAFVGGIIVHASEAIVFLSALVAFWGNWKWIGFNFFLLLLGTVQIFLSPGDDPASGWVHGLHGLFALFVLIAAAAIAQRDVRLLGLRRGTEPEVTSRPMPPV